MLPGAYAANLALRPAIGCELVWELGNGTNYFVEALPDKSG